MSPAATRATLSCSGLPSACGWHDAEPRRTFASGGERGRRSTRCIHSERSVQLPAAPRRQPRRDPVQRRRRERVWRRRRQRKPRPSLHLRRPDAQRPRLLSHRLPPRRGEGVALLAPAGKIDPPRSLVGGPVARAPPRGAPSVLPGTYGSGAARPEDCRLGPRPRMPRSSSGSPGARTGGTARRSSCNHGNGAVRDPLAGAVENSTAAPSLRIISTETTRLHSAGRSGARRIARLTRPEPKRPPSPLLSPVFGPTALASGRDPGPGDSGGNGAQPGRW